MAFFEKDELPQLYSKANDEAYQWRKNYTEYERLADNGLLEDLDETLPEVNDGSLAAALFKFQKRAVPEFKGKAKALDVDDAWITELANIYWTNKILPNANLQATPDRKRKDAARKAAIYGSQPVIALLDDKDGERCADFIVPYCQDVYLEPGKVSDTDSDIIFWDVYFTHKQIRDLIEQAERKEDDSKWDVKRLKELLKRKESTDREAKQEHYQLDGKAVTRGGMKFYIAFQKGKEAPFYMCDYLTDKCVREWVNPDPTGDIPVTYLYYYQDFINPYGVGVCKLAGGTQNILDLYRKYDVKATQLGLRPPKKIQGNEEDVDEDSMVYEEEANWYVGNADVTIVETTGKVYDQLPTRISMAKTSLNQLIPTGDTSISGEAGDPNYSKTPAGVKFQAAALSVDDEDFKQNMYEFDSSLARTLINLTFANMQGMDLLKLSDEERERLQKAGLEFPLDAEGNPSNELEIIWDESRATFDFVVEPEEDEDTERKEKLEGIMRVLELQAADPMFDQKLAMSGKKLDSGELLATAVELITDNTKIVIDITPEDQEAMAQEEMMMQEQMMAQQQGQSQAEMQPEAPQELDEETISANIDAVMQQYGVNEQTAAEMLDAEASGMPPEQVLATLEQAMGGR